jgi:predicted P-loop ATPase
MSNRIGNEAQRMKDIIELMSGKGEFRFNVVLGKVEIKKLGSDKYVEIDDYLLNSLARELNENDIICSPQKLDNILRSDITPPYDPFKEYLNQLPQWDGQTDYIENLAGTVETTNNAFWNMCLKRWLIAMVASLENEQLVNHTVLILVGKQGSGKTSWIDKLVPTQLRSNYYYSGTINLGAKDTIIMLSESMIINLEELSTLSEKQLNELKEIITKKNIRLRRPYGRVNETLPRRASFTGSTNDKKILSDTTGSRRFLVFEAVRINYQHSVDIDQVLSQALGLYRIGTKFWFDESEIQTINQNNEQYRFKSVEEEFLLSLFSPCEEKDKTHTLSTSEIMAEINKGYKIPITDASLLKFGKALRLHNFKRVRYKNGYGYWLKENNDAVISRLRRVS